MKKLILASATIMSFSGVAYAVDPPDWMKQVTPPQQLSSAWQEYQAIFSDGALPEKTKELVGLAVAAQIPCQYCIIAHTRWKLNRQPPAAGKGKEDILLSKKRS